MTYGNPRANIIQHDRGKLTKYFYEQTNNNVYVCVNVDGVPAEPPYSVEWRDMVGGKQGTLLVRQSKNIHGAIANLHSRDWDYVRVFAEAEDDAHFDALLLREWKAKRCLYRGLPNKPAEILLKGLRGPVIHPLRYGPEGRVVRDDTMSDLAFAKLVDMHDPVPGKSRGRATTNLRGYEVMKHWADNISGFLPYLKAYLPKNWEKDYTANAVFEAMTK